MTAGLDLSIPARDGRLLAATVHRPWGAAPARPHPVVISSATGVPRQFYGAFARHLAQHGFTAVTYDYRGIGGSRLGSPRRETARMRDWGELDLAGVLAWAAGELGAAPLLVAHSVGGQIAGLAPNAHLVRALMLVAAQSGDWLLWDGRARVKVWALFHLLIPAAVRALGYLPGAVMGGEPLPGGVASEWAGWVRRRDYLAGGGDAWRRAGFERLAVPLRAYTFSDDDIAPPRAAAALLAWYRRADVSHVHLSPADAGGRAIGHFGFFRREHADRLWPDAVRWLTSATDGSARARGA